MLIPQFTTRTLLIITTLCGFFFFTVSAALEGAAWAAGIVTMVCAVLAVFLLSPLVFYAALLVHALFTAARRVGVPPSKPRATPPVVLAEDAE